MQTLRKGRFMKNRHKKSLNKREREVDRFITKKVIAMAVLEV